jgi:hypothetical protein
MLALLDEFLHFLGLLTNVLVGAPLEPKENGTQ